MSQAGLVSIIIPSFNYGAFIADTIVSIQSQSYENWELIVVDDGSDDDTKNRVALLMQEDARIFYLFQQNQGVSVARNTGMAGARGEFVLFLDADDLLTSSKLQSHVEHFQRCPDVDISYSRFRYFSDARRDVFFTNYKLDSLREREKPLSGYGRETFPVFIRKNPLPLQAAIFRRSILLRVGAFEPDMRALEDWDFLLRSILRGACMEPVADSVAMTLIRVHPGSATKKILFSDYMGRVYDNVRIEIDRLRSIGSEEIADFYFRCLQEALANLEIKRAGRARKARRLEIMDSIRKAGAFDFIKLYPVVSKWRFEFLGAYLRVLSEKACFFKK